MSGKMGGARKALRFVLLLSEETENGEHMIQSTTLHNRLWVGLEPVPSLHTVSIGVWVKTGSRYETVPENGAAHLIEHMLFKGTLRLTARRITEEIEER